MLSFQRAKNDANYNRQKPVEWIVAAGEEFEFKKCKYWRVNARQVDVTSNVHCSLCGTLQHTAVQIEHIGTILRNKQYALTCAAERYVVTGNWSRIP